MRVTQSPWGLQLRGLRQRWSGLTAAGNAHPAYSDLMGDRQIRTVGTKSGLILPHAIAGL